MISYFQSYVVIDDWNKIRRIDFNRTTQYAIHMLKPPDIRRESTVFVVRSEPTSRLSDVIILGIT